MPIAAAIPSIIGLGGSLIGKAFGGSGAPAPTAADTALANNVSGSTDALKTLAGSTADKGTSFLNSAQTSLAGPQQYFSQLLSGNAAQTTQALAPDISRLRGAAQNTIQQASNLAPRGGGRSSTLFDLPTNTSSAIQGDYNGARPAAASSLMQLGQLQGGLGGQLTSAGLAGQSDLLRSLIGEQNYNKMLAQQQQQMQYQKGQSLGGGLFNIASGIDWSKLGGGGGGGVLDGGIP